MAKTIEVDCRKCLNCTGNSCKCYGKDANVAVKKCADDGFKNYKKSRKPVKAE